ncbi:FAAR007Wp [Eremothecium gossypii FDAG1]|nr:FAAR007Wp [Eremothecium gossypii FDAG1]
MAISAIAKDITRFTLQNVNDVISFKPHLCHEVPARHYDMLRQEYISYTGTSIRKNKCKLFYLPTNVSDELNIMKQLSPDIGMGSGHGGAVQEHCGVKMENNGAWAPEKNGGYGGNSRTVYYKKRLITELDYENVKRVEKACMLIAYAAVNQCLHIETSDGKSSGGLPYSRSAGDDDDEERDHGPGSGEEYCEECARKSLERGEMLGFRELGYLINITPWHFHRVFKVLAGLTIREYGQLCCDFLKGQEDILFRVRDRVTLLRECGHSFSCLDDEEFMGEDVSAITSLDCGSLEDESEEASVVVLPDYFIDPNKSKELKKKLKEQKSNGTTSDHGNRIELRKRRYSLMSHRIMKASASSIKNNPTIMDCLENCTITRDEYERRQSQRYLQRSKLKKRGKKPTQLAAVRKPPYHRRTSSESHGILKNAVMDQSTVADMMAAAEQESQDCISHEESLPIFQGPPSGRQLDTSSASSTSASSSALPPSYDYDQDSQSLGHFSSPTQSVLDFKFPPAMATGHQTPDLNSVLNSTTPVPPQTVASAGTSVSSGASSALAVGASAPDPFAGDSYKYSLGVGLSSMGTSDSAMLPGAGPAAGGMFYDPLVMPTFPAAASDFDAATIAAAPGTPSQGGPANYNISSMVYSGLPLQQQPSQQQQQQLFDFGPLFGAPVASQAAPPYTGNPPALGTMEYLVSSSGGIFKDDEDGL